MQIANRLEKLGIISVVDLLLHLPYRYEDRTRVRRLADIVPGEQVLVQGYIESAKLSFGRRRSLVCVLNDGSGRVSMRFFYFGAAQQKSLTCGVFLRCFGEVRSGFRGLEMIHPEYEACPDDPDSFTEAHFTPVYALTQGLRQTLMRRLILQAFDRFSGGDNQSGPVDWIPAPLLHERGFPSFMDGLRMLHFPPVDADISELGCCRNPAQQRFIFEELVAHALCLNGSRRDVRKQSAPVFRRPVAIFDSFASRLPFALTAAQFRVINEIQDDFLSASPMMRLVHGDVGSGKTVVAAHAALSVLSAGYQVALMAPTELLAEQHFKTISDWFRSFQFEIGLLVGNKSETERQETQKRLHSGEIHLVIGTHALFQKSVHFFRLGLVIIDEQHRFGVQHRLALREKGRQNGRLPHQLIMTATPIPRTLAMLQYADMDVSVLDELPKGRIPVQTSVLPASRRSRVIDRVAQWIRDGRQVYWVCTLIDESDVLQCEAVERTFAMLGEALPEARVSMIHGKLKGVDRDRVMSAFIEHGVDLLVATTVIEVGVNVPNADLMVIENSERLGLAQLHQLRGRIGRGNRDAYCVLMYQAPLSQVAKQRLAILRQTGDGFRIAEKDLEMRGPGELLGTQQTGQFRFRISDLVRDQSLVADAVWAAEVIQTKYADRVNPIIRRWVGESSRFSDV